MWCMVHEISEKSKFWKNEKNTWTYYYFTHVYQKWQSYDAWFLRHWAWQTEFFVILDHFLPFYPSNNPKNQNFEKIKKNLEILTFYTCVAKMAIIWCMVPEILSATDWIVCHFGSFFTLLGGPNNPKNQNFEKIKKPTGNIISHMCSINDNHMMNCSWDMEHDE